MIWMHLGSRVGGAQCIIFLWWGAIQWHPLLLSPSDLFDMGTSNTYKNHKEGFFLKILKLHFPLFVNKEPMYLGLAHEQRNLSHHESLRDIFHCTGWHSWPNFIKSTALISYSKPLSGIKQTSRSAHDRDCSILLSCNQPKKALLVDPSSTH